MRGAALFARLVRFVARRPVPVLAAVGLLAVLAAVYALRLQPSASTDTLVNRSSQSFKATEQFKKQFGDDAVVVLVKASKRGLPAVSSFLDSTRPVLAQADPFLRSLNPFLDWVGEYKHEAAAFFALDAAATQATAAVCDKPVQRCTSANNSKQVHYLRTTNPVNPEALAAYPKRIASNRSNPYFQPLGYLDLARGGLKVFGTYLCTTNPVPTVVQTIDPLLPGVGAITSLISPETFTLIDRFVYGGNGPANVASPPCREQAPLGNLIGQSGKYPHVTAAP